LVSRELGNAQINSERIEIYFNMADFGLIGKKLQHSFSKTYFTEKFAKEGLQHNYLNFEIDSVNQLPEIWKNNSQLVGVNVTIPYKSEVIPLLDELDDTAAIVGAVNTIKIIRENDAVKTKGYNTDVIGFGDSLKKLLKPYHNQALILGTGGAAKAVATVLSDFGVKYKYVSRNPKPGQMCYNDICLKVVDKYKVIINTSPLGMYPNVEAFPDLPYVLMDEMHLLYDLIYNPEETMFMKKGKERGAMVKNGLEMLHGQAEAAWKIWNS
jgi:shikimate dehydrogenase